MASKGKLNGFSLFMRERRNQLKREGHDFAGGLKDVAVYVEHEWKELTEDKRDDYKQRAKFMNEQNGLGGAGKPPLASGSSFPSYSGGGQEDLRRTSLGMTFQEVKDNQQVKANRLLEHNAELVRVMQQGDPTEITFVLINFSMYGQLVQKAYVPAELGLTAFNVKDGIIDNYCTLIDPYELPQGLGIEAQKAAAALAVPVPPFDNSCQDYEQILNILEGFLDRHMHAKIEKRKLYCLNNEMRGIQGCLEWLYNQIPGRENKFQLFSFGEAIRILANVGLSNRVQRENRAAHQVVNDLMNECRHRDTEKGCKQVSSTASDLAVTSVSSGAGYGITTIKNADTEHVRVKAGAFHHEKEVEEYLDSLNFAFDGQIGCLYHLNKDDGLQFCALNVTNRYAYNVLNAIVPIFGVTPRLSYHIPDLRETSEMEVQRRGEMLEFWGHRIFSPDDLKFDYRKSDPKKTTVYPDLGPNRPQ